MMRITFGFFVLAGFGLPAWVYFRFGFPVWSIAIVLVAAVWMLAFQQGWSIYPAAGLVLGLAANAAASWLHPQPDALILSALLTLAAWDLDLFRRRLRLAGPQDDIGGLVRRHLKGLLVFLFCAAAISLLALWFPLKLAFWVGVVLLVIVFAGLVELVRGLLAVGRTLDRQG